MRWLYHAIEFKADEFEVIEETREAAPGKIRVASTLVRSASVHALLSDMIRTVEGHHVYLLTIAPKDIPPGLYKDSKLPRMTYVVCHPSDYRVGFYPAHFFMDSVMYRFQYGGRNSKHTALPLDVICSGTPFSARRIMMQLASRVRDVPAVCRHESSYSPSGNVVEEWGKPGNDQRLRRGVAAESLGIGHIFLSGKDRKNFCNLFIRPTYAATAHREWLDDSRVMPNGVDCDYVEGLRGKVRRTKRTVGSFARPTKQKGTKDVLELYNRMAITGQINRAVVTWNRADDLATFMGVEPSGKFDFYPKCGREQYLKIAAECGCFISNSTNESSPFLVAECMAMGVVPILPQREWVDSMPGRWELTYRTLEDAAKLVHMVFDDQAGWSKRAKAYAREHYDAFDRCSTFITDLCHRAQLAGVFSQMNEAEFGKWCQGSKIVESLGELLVGRDSIGWYELFSKFKFPHTQMGGQVVLTHNDLPDLLRRKFGFVDDLDSAIPRFVRE